MIFWINFCVLFLATQQTFDLPNNRGTYYYQSFNSKRDVSNAERFCNGYNGTLAIMINDIQNAAAFASIPKDTGDRHYYIGSNKCMEIGEGNISCCLKN